MSTVTQFEFRHSNERPTNTASRSRLSEVVLTATVALLVGGSFYLGASSVRATNHQDLLPWRKVLL